MRRLRLQRQKDGMVQLNVWCRREDVPKVRKYIARLNRATGSDGGSRE